jgi:hypothetical protein
MEHFASFTKIKNGLKWSKLSNRAPPVHWEALPFYIQKQIELYPGPPRIILRPPVLFAVWGIDHKIFPGISMQKATTIELLGMPDLYHHSFSIQQALSNVHLRNRQGVLNNSSINLCL